MQQLIRRLHGSAFIRHNAVFFIGSLSVGALNYLYYPVLGRLMVPGSFGEVQVLASMLLQITIFLNVLGLITVNIVANYDNVQKRNRIIMELERLALAISAVLLLATVLGGMTLKHFFRFDSPIPFAILMLAIIATVPLTFRNAYLRGTQHFGLVSIVTIVGSAADLVLAALFVVFGWGTTGVMAALVIGQLIAFALAAISARKNGFSESLRSSLLRLPDIHLILPELKYALLVLVASLSITGMYSLDTIVVKHYFDAHTAGLYAGISTIARIIFFLTASVVQVLIPAVKLHQPIEKNQKVLLKSFGLLIIIGGVALAMFTFLPHLVISILMGRTFLPFADLLPRLGLVVFVISVLNLLIMYHLALRHYWVAPIIIIGVLLTLELIQSHHANIQAIINNLLIGSMSILLLLGIWIGVGKLKSSVSSA